MHWLRCHSYTQNKTHHIFKWNLRVLQQSKIVKFPDLLRWMVKRATPKFEGIRMIQDNGEKNISVFEQ